MAFPDTGLWIPNITQANDIDWTSLKVALVKDTWSPSIDGTYSYSSIGSDEASGTGYSSGGMSLTSVSVDRTGGKFVVTADQPVFSGLSGVADVAGCVFYCDTSSSPVANAIVAVTKFSETAGSVSGTLTIPLLSSPSTNTVVAIRNPGVS